MIGVTAVPNTSPYFEWLLYAGIGGMTVGFVGLMALLIFQPRRDHGPTAPSTPAPQPLVQQNVTSHGQSGGITAHTVNREPDPIPQRRLSSEQAAAIAHVLSNSPHKGVLLEVQFASNEHATFAAAIASIFERCGWTRRTLCIPSREHPHGMRVARQGERSDAYRVAIDALKAASLDFIEDEYEGPDADVSLDVGILHMTPFQKAADKWPD